MATRVTCIAILMAFGFGGLRIDAEEVRNAADLQDDNALLSREDVRRELEVIDAQTDALERTRQKGIERFQQYTLRKPFMDPQDSAAMSRAILADYLREQHATKQEVFLPHQLRRLEQIRWQYRALGDPVKALTIAFPLTDEQGRRMRSLEEELRSALLDEMWESYRDAQQEILQLLTPEQRATWFNAAGDQFRFESSQPGLGILNQLK